MLKYLVPEICTIKFHKGDTHSIIWYKFLVREDCILFGAGFWYQKKTCTRKHDTCSRNRRKFLGTRFVSVCHPY